LAITIACAWLGLTGPFPAQVSAQYEPPASYYNSATGTGLTLKSQLHNIIDNHTVLSYADLRYGSNPSQPGPLADTDEDPNNPNNILLVYDRSSTNEIWDSAHHQQGRLGRNLLSSHHDGRRDQ